MMSAASSGGGATASALSSFNPFHWIGLCEAVAIIPPSADRCLIIMATPGVVTMSRSINSTPDATSAAAAASRTHQPLGRESRPKTRRKNRPLIGLRLLRSHDENAMAMLPTTAGVRLPPIVPRIPEIPIIKASMRFPTVGGQCPPYRSAGIYGIADSARKGYDALDDAPAHHAVRVYVRRINSAAPSVVR